MKTSRREAIKAAMAAGAALIGDLGWLAERCDATPIGSTLRGEILAAHAAAPWPTRAAFEACVGDLFTVRRGSQLTALRLARVADVPCAHAAGVAGHAECFAVVFDGAAGDPLTQDTYPMENATLGHLQVFVVPAARPNAVSYVATFNRVLPDPSA